MVYVKQTDTDIIIHLDLRYTFKFLPWRSYRYIRNSLLYTAVGNRDTLTKTKELKLRNRK